MRYSSLTCDAKWERKRCPGTHGPLGHGKTLGKPAVWFTPLGKNVHQRQLHAGKVTQGLPDRVGGVKTEPWGTVGGGVPRATVSSRGEHTFLRGPTLDWGRLKVKWASLNGLVAMVSFRG